MRWGKRIDATGPTLVRCVVLLLASIGARDQCRAEPGDERRVAIAPSVEMSFRWIEPGDFLIGSPDGERRRDADEGPQARVAITRGFYLGVYEVTQRQWQTVMGENPAAFQQGDSPERRPVESVSWNDCAEFLHRLGAVRVGTFRFPTESEWEYACRAGSTTLFYWGDIDEDWE
ncbi:MAG: formylglycine-generating enzyme family protein, partial [Planctomycetota bacterium]